jgi:pilus assembly protein CpaB
MNWNRMLIGLGTAIAVGLLASIFVYRQVKNAMAVKPVATNQVVVAATRLPLGTLLQPQNLRVASWPAGGVLPGMCTQIEDCANRALITSVVENEPILEGKLAPKEAGAGLSATIPEGMRAVSVQVNEVIGVAGFVLPGTMVDVLVTGSVGRRGGGTSITRTILEDIRVLAAGQKIEQDKEGKPQTVPVVTLLVTPQEANELTMASTEGKIQLALRNTLDAKKVDPRPVYQASLFGGAPPAPRSPGPVIRRTRPAPETSPYAVEVIRGGKREMNTFTNP